MRSLALLRVGLALLVIIDLVQRSFDLKAHYTDLGILPRWALTHGLGNVWSVSLHNLSGTSELEAAGFVFTRNRARGTASAWLLTDLLTNKKTRPIASRFWRFQPPKHNNLRTNLTTQTRGFSTALRRQRPWVRIPPSLPFLGTNKPPGALQGAYVMSAHKVGGIRNWLFSGAGE